MPHIHNKQGVKRLILKSEQLADRFQPGVTITQIGDQARVSWPTIHKYMTRPDGIPQFSGSVLAQFLTDGLGLTTKQAGDLRLSEVFDFVDTFTGDLV